MADSREDTSTRLPLSHHDQLDKGGGETVERGEVVGLGWGERRGRRENEERGVGVGGGERERKRKRKGDN